MITIGQYYRVQTSAGERTAKAMQLIIDGVYGVYSISNYEHEDDLQGVVIPEGSEEATQEQIEAFNLWFNG